MRMFQIECRGEYEPYKNNKNRVGYFGRYAIVFAANEEEAKELFLQRLCLQDENILEFDIKEVESAVIETHSYSYVKKKSKIG